MAYHEEPKYQMSHYLLHLPFESHTHHCRLFPRRIVDSYDHFTGIVRKFIAASENRIFVVKNAPKCSK